MAHHVIKQPDGRYAVFSTVVDSWVCIDATADELRDYYAERAAIKARKDTNLIIDSIESGDDSYYNATTMSFQEADDKSFQVTGQRLSDYHEEAVAAHAAKQGEAGNEST